MLPLNVLTPLGAALDRSECMVGKARGDICVAEWRGGATLIAPDGGQTLFAGPAPGNRLLKPNGIALRGWLVLRRPLEPGYRRRLRTAARRPGASPRAWDDTGFGGDCVYHQQKHLIEAFTAGRDPVNTGRAYLRNYAIEEAVYRAREERRQIDTSASSKEGAA